MCFLRKGGGLFGAGGWEFSSIISTASAFLSSSSDRRASVSPPLGISHSHTIPRLGPIRSSLYTPYPSNKATIGRLPLPEVTVSHADKAVRFLAAGSSRRGRTIVKVASALFQYPLLPFGSVFCRSRAGDIFRNRQSRVKHAVIISWLCLAPPRHAGVGPRDLVGCCPSHPRPPLPLIETLVRFTSNRLAWLGWV